MSKKLHKIKGHHTHNNPKKRVPKQKTAIQIAMETAQNKASPVSPKQIDPKKTSHSSKEAPITNTDRPLLQTNSDHKPHEVSERGLWEVQVYTNPTEQEVELILGLNFGTCATKVMIRDNSSGNCYPVPIGKILDSGNDFFIPTEITCDAKGEFALPVRVREGSSYYNDIKRKVMKLIDNGDESQSPITTSELVVAYLAYILQHAHRWFMQIHFNEYHSEQKKLDWQLNIGVPSDSQDSGEFKQRFIMLAEATWLASVDCRGVNLKTVKAALDNQKRIEHLIDTEIYGERTIHTDHINVIPEVLAVIYGYKVSGTATSGINLMIDVGAGTLDSAVLLVHENDSMPSFQYIGDRVTPLGAFSLHEHRVDKIHRHGTGIKAVNEIPPTLQSYINEIELDTMENDFKKSA